MSMQDDLVVSNLSVMNNLTGDAIWWPPALWESGWLSAYKGHFGQGATPLAGTAALVTGPTVAPFSKNGLGLDFLTGGGSVLGFTNTNGTHATVGAAHVEAATLTSNMSGLNATSTKKEVTNTPNRPINGMRIKFNGHANGARLHRGGILVRTMANHSDIRIKKKVRPLDSANSLSRILKLQGVSFHWRKEMVPLLAEKYSTNVGFIAQQVESIVPEVMDKEIIDLSGRNDKKMEIKTLRYENLTALLVESIKEQQKQIDALKARVATLEAA